MSCWNRFRLACPTSAMTMPLNWENECDYRNCHASDISPISGHFWGYFPSSLLCGVAQRHLATTSGRHRYICICLQEMFGLWISKNSDHLTVCNSVKNRRINLFYKCSCQKMCAIARYASHDPWSSYVGHHSFTMIHDTENA